MPHLICYDITGDTLRTQLSKKIIASGLDRINKSVYLGTIGESSLTSLATDLQQLMQNAVHGRGGGALSSRETVTWHAKIGT